MVFFDVLLTALNTVQRQYPFYIRGPGSTLILQLILCYADDLHLVSSCLAATKQSNLIISAFAAMFSIRFDPVKARAISTRSDPGTMTLHDWKWQPTIVHEFKDPDQLITSLGVTYNLQYNWDKQFLCLKERFQQVGSVLSRRHASTMLRSTLQQNGSSTPKLLYPTQFSPFTEDQHDELTRLLIRPLRKATNINRRLAGNVLSNPALGGFAHDIHAQVQAAKHRLID